MSIGEHTVVTCTNENHFECRTRLVLDGEWFHYLDEEDLLPEIKPGQLGYPIEAIEVELGLQGWTVWLEDHPTGYKFYAYSCARCTALDRAAYAATKEGA